MTEPPKLTPEEEGRVARLCPELAVLLHAELQAGNYVVETWDNWGFMVLLGLPFLVQHAVDETTVGYRDVNDPHYWKAEYFSKQTGQSLGCRFAPWADLRS